MMEIQVIVRVKTCQTCGIEFTVTATPSGSGSLNSLRRKYCSVACKRNGTKEKSNIAINVTCCCCGSMFKTYPSIMSTYCSNACKHKMHGALLRKEREIKRCLGCESEFEVIKGDKRKHCCSSCISLAAQKRKIQCKCAVCGKEFLRSKHRIRSKNTFCGRSCQYIGQSCGLIKIKTNGRFGERVDIPGIVFRSSFEADFMRVALYKGKQFQFEPKTFEIELPSGKIAHYTPDFFDVEQRIFYELKACKKSDDNFSKLMNSNIASVEELQRSIKLEIVYMREFYDDLKREGLYSIIPNIENRDYYGTRYLICDS